MLMMLLALSIRTRYGDMARLTAVRNRTPGTGTVLTAEQPAQAEHRALLRCSVQRCTAAGIHGP